MGVNFFFQGKITSPCKTYLGALENPFLRMSSSSHLFLFLTRYSRVCATGKTATEMCVSFSPGSSLKRQQAPSLSNLHHYIITLALLHISENSLPLPSQTIQFPAPYTDTSLQFCRSRPGVAFALWSYVILWIWVSMEQLSMLATAGTEEAAASLQLWYKNTYTRAKGRGNHSQSKQSSTEPQPPCSCEVWGKGPSSHLEGNRGRMGSMPNPKVLL